MAHRREDGQVEIVEYPYFDHLLLGVGISGLTNETHLYRNAQVIGKPQFTNMEQAGSFPDGGVGKLTSLRAFANFMDLSSTEYTVAYGTIAAVTQPTSSATRMLDCYDMLNYGFQVELKISSKTYLILPWWMFPSGAGSYGFTTVSGRSIVTSSVPSRQAVAYFKEEVVVDTLQSWEAIVRSYPFDQSAIAGAFTGSAQGGTITGDLDPVLFLNQADGRKIAGLCVGCIKSRD